MNGLDLLLSYSPHSEAVHQMTLACLLKDGAIARSLGLTGTPKDSFIETNGRLDITVEMENGLLSHVELKINATFRRRSGRAAEELRRRKSRRDDIHLARDAAIPCFPPNCTSDTGKVHANKR